VEQKKNIERKREREREMEEIERSLEEGTHDLVGRTPVVVGRGGDAGAATVVGRISPAAAAAATGIHIYI